MNAVQTCTKVNTETMSCQAMKKVQRSTSNPQTSTSHTQGIKFENKTEKIFVFVHF